MDSSRKLYVKAMNCFNDADMDKAMRICERSISEDIKNASSINLKGLLYYLKGDLENAQALWKMNYQVNKDAVSKRYLDDSSGDAQRKLLYLDALKLVKQLRINEAVELLEKCGESDFNYINVSNYLAFCYIKQGEYDKAMECVEHTLSMDRKDRDALKYRKLLMEFGMIKQHRFNKAAAVSVVLLLALAIYFGMRFVPAKHSLSDKNLAVVNSVKTTAVNPTAVSGKSPAKAKETSKTGAAKASDVKDQPVKQAAFPTDEFNSYYSNKDFDKLYDDVLNWKDKNLGAEDKTTMDKAIALLKDEGIEYFNKTALHYQSLKDYNNALAYFTKGYNFSEGSYLHPHLEYMLGSTYESLGNIDKAISFYKDYDNNNPKGDYEDTVLYELAMIYKDNDLATSKGFAQKLQANFPNSIYNNINIKGILSK